MLLLVTSLKLIAEIALMALAGQWVVGLLAGARRDHNVFYKLLEVVASPFVKLVRRITPRVVLDRHVPLAAFLLLSVAWVALTATKIKPVPAVGSRCMSLNAGRLAYWRLKLQALALLVLGRREAALDVFSAMLARWPGDAYALASRAHLHAQLGRARRGARRRAGADAGAPAAQRRRLVQPRLPARRGRPPRRSRAGVSPGASRSTRSSTAPGTASACC